MLGPLEVTADGQSLAVVVPGPWAVLALLLVRANQVDSSDRLVEELWPGQPSRQGRRQLAGPPVRAAQDAWAAGEADRLATRAPGYLLRVTPGELDALRFEQLTGAGRCGAGRRGCRHGGAVVSIRPWACGAEPALAGFDTVPSARAEAGRLEEQRLAALESRAEALLACTTRRDLTAELETLTTAHPLRERFWYQRMLALYRSGRQADALRAYRELRDILIAELAIEPGPGLRELQGRILRQDPALGGPLRRARSRDRRRSGRCGPADPVRPDRRTASTSPTRCSARASGT